MLNFKKNDLYFYFVLLLLTLQIKAQCIGTSQNQLINPSFETPAQINIGNNIINWPINGWNGVGANPNIVKTNGGPSTGGPNSAKQGVQYLDVVGSSADFYQEFNFQCNTQVFFSGYFSVRDNRASTGRIDLLRINSNNTTTLVASSNQLNMPSTANIWYLASGSTVLLPGKYRFNITMGEDSNFDDACFSFDYPNINTGSYGPLCENSGSITLTGTPTDSFGTWSGNGIVDNGNGTASFNPLGLDGTIVTANYSHYNAAGFGCTQSTNISVNPSITPTFTQIVNNCNGTTFSALPTTSINGITGTWSPAINNTSTTTYTFTPLAGQCANNASMTIIIDPKITPTFTQVPSICSGTTLNPLPTTSGNGITGTWSPALNNTATTTYTFTPNAGQCGSTATMTISIYPAIVAPTGLSTQSFCSSATISDLVVTGNSIKWYDAATGGDLIPNTTALVNGNTYYASSSSSSCESSTRLAVTATLQNIPEITSSNTTICANQSVQLGIVYTPPTICNMNITPTSIPLGNPIPGFTYGGLYNGHYYYIYNTPTTWTAGELISRQNGGYLVCINDINENQFVSNLTNNNIWIGLFRDPTTCQFRWLDCMDITFTNWRTGEPNNDPCDEPYTQIIRGCSFGLNTWNNLNDVSTNGSCYSYMVPIMEIDPSIYNTSIINSNTNYLWSTGETTSSINPTPLTTTTYWVDVTTNGATCRKSITITVKNSPAPTGAAKQQFCNDTSIAALAVKGTAVKWYASATGTTALNNTTALANGTTYFATQTIDGCESSNRFQTTVSIVKVPTPKGDEIQKFCLEGNPIVSNLIATGNSILWFDALTNGMAIDNTTLLQDNTTYYATTLDAATGCESLQRLAVKVDLFKCDITAYNLITINGNSLNDQLTFEDISYFPDNSVKIYNRYGKLVWETTGYDNTNNAFKGKANVSGLFMKDSFLPAGTYFYILVYNNTYTGKQTELTGYLQIDNAN